MEAEEFADGAQYPVLPCSNLADSVGTVSGSGSHNPEPGTTITWSGGSNMISVDHSAVRPVRLVLLESLMHYLSGKS